MSRPNLVGILRGPPADVYGRSRTPGTLDDVKRLWNRTLIERIEIKGGQVAGVALKQPFAILFLLASSNKGTLVGGTRHYLNSPTRVALRVVDLIRTMM
jgi:hypothetical protein